MADVWLNEYMEALEARDRVEKANVDFYEACLPCLSSKCYLSLLCVDTRMADRTASLQTTQAASATKEPDRPSTTPPPPIVGRTWSGRQQSVTPPTSEVLNTLRSDLASAQQSRADLQSRLDATIKELTSLRTQSKKDTKRISQLSAEVTHLTVRLRDRDEELRGKSKLLDDVQDENATLHMQLNVSDENHKKLKAENQELVDRWMQRIKGEADKMNEGSKYS